MTEATQSQANLHGIAGPRELRGVTVQRERLHAALIQFEDAAASAAGSRLEAWQGQMTNALRQVREAFDAHIGFTESEGGLYDDILQAAPRLAGALRGVRDEHPVIAGALGELAEALLVAGVEPNEWVNDMRERSMRVLGLLVRHRQTGADLTYAAFEQELGGSD